MGLRGVLALGPQSSGRAHETATSSSSLCSPYFPVYRHNAALSFALAQQVVALWPQARPSRLLRQLAALEQRELLT
jgi:hypothetical protein